MLKLKSCLGQLKSIHSSKKMLIWSFASPSCGLHYGDFESLAKNEKIASQIKLILAEFNYLSLCEDSKIPSNLSLQQMKHLLRCWKVKKMERSFFDVSVKQRIASMNLFHRNEFNEGKNQLFTTFMPHQVSFYFIHSFIHRFF